VLLVLVLALLFGGLGCGARQLAPTYDALVVSNEGVAKEWAGVEAHLQRRYDLIPNLVEVAKASAAHESAIFVEIASGHDRYRSARTVSDRIDASYRTEDALRRLPLVVRESFPTLQSNARFTDLMRSLEKTEDGILKQRLRYNEAVAAFNSRQKTIEGRVVSVFGPFQPARYYDPPESSQQRLALVAPSSGPGLEVKAGVEVPSASASASVEAGAPAAVDAGPAAASSTRPSLAAQYRVTGVMAVDGARQAVVVGPDGKAFNVKKGTLLPGTNARVVAVDELGVTVEDRADGAGAPTTFRLQ
jgi:LemA protein